MKNQDVHKRMDLLRYYKHAPTIVENIRKRPDSYRIFSEIFVDIEAAIDLIKKGELDPAYEIFATKIKVLESQYLEA